MTLLNVAHSDDEPEPSSLRLDGPSLALLRSVASGRLPHPSLSGPTGERVRRRLVAQGALRTDDTMTPETSTLLAPIVTPRRIIGVHHIGPNARCRQVWIGPTRATVACTGTSGDLFLRPTDPSRLGIDLLQWLSIRPLPERVGRTALIGSPAELIDLARALNLGEHPHAARLATDLGAPTARPLMARLVLGEVSGWVVTTRTVDDTDRGDWCTAIDAGREGWHLGTGGDDSYVVPNRLCPVGITEVYLALARVP